MARCVDGIDLFSIWYLPNQLSRITSTANRLENNNLLFVLKAGRSGMGFCNFFDMILCYNFYIYYLHLTQNKNIYVKINISTLKYWNEPAQLLPISAQPF